jgi:hypothetical protein
VAAVTFDTLKCARRLMAAGMSEELAAAQAEVMAEAFVMNVDNLVTKDYLEVCLKGLGDRLEARLDEHDRRFEAIDARFDKIDARLDRMDARFDRVDARFAEMASNFRLMYWILAAISMTTVIPALHKLFSGTLLS